MTHDPRDVETMARVVCEAQGANPDAPQDMEDNPAPNWHLDRALALGLLDVLQAKGWKITSNDASDKQWPKGIAAPGPWFAWRRMHAAAPIVPRSEP